MPRARVGRPTSEYSQAIRILSLYDRLHREKMLRVHDLVGDVGLRTVQRDIRILQAALGPAVKVEKSPPVVRLVDAQRFKRISSAQVMGLSLGMQMVRFLSGRTFAADVKPLLTALRSGFRSPMLDEMHQLEQMIYVPEAGQKLYRENKRLSGVLDQMVEGLLLRQPIELKYLSPRRKAEGRSPERFRVQALCLTLHRGAAYFVVDVLPGDSDSTPKRLLLALDRMSDIQIDSAAKALEYPANFKAAEHFRSAFGVWTGSETHDVRLLIDQTYSDAVRERTWHVTQRLEELPDRSVELRMQLGRLEEVADWVLGMGEHARVEAPTELVELVKTRLEQALRQYR